MSVVSFFDVTKSFGAKILFKDSTFSIMKGKKVALFGDNGSGKTTLLKLLTGKEEPDNGRIIVTNDTKIGYLEQFTVQNKSIFDFMLEANNKILLLEKSMAECQDPVRLPEMYEEFEKVGGNAYRSLIREVLTAFEFEEATWGKDIATLSGGELERLMLARLLASDANLLVLDEPTNYLDILMIEWLEDFLINTDKTVIFVTHDRRVLENVADEILHIANQKITHYRMGLKKFLEHYEKKVTLLKLKKQNLEEEKERLANFIDKYRAGIKARQVTSRMNNLKKIEDELGSLKLDNRIIDFSFKKKSEENYEVIKGKDVVLGYGSEILNEKFDFTIYRGEKVAIIGKNGSGKTTFLKAIVGKQDLLKGQITVGDRAKMGYFEQIYKGDAEQVVLDELLSSTFEITLQDIYNLLPKFGMDIEDLYKKTGLLSGGELAKVALMKLFFVSPNVLLMDEPTNHLDYETVEVLKNSLKGYDGTLVVVSHDRYFMDGLIDKYIFLNNGRVEIKPSYPLIETLLQEKRKEVKNYNEKADKKKRVNKFKVDKMQQEIFELENYLNSLYEESKTYAADWKELDHCNRKIEDTESELLAKYEQFEKLMKEDL
jgi:ATP-binding cassette subfamily F protein 3